MGYLMGTTKKRPERRFIADTLAETEGFEPSIQVCARMLP